MIALGRNVRLTVRNEGFEAWRWKMCLDTPENLYAVGVSQTKIAAQVGAQLAFERWLHINHKPQKDRRYMWVEEIG